MEQLALPLPSNGFMLWFWRAMCVLAAARAWAKRLYHRAYLAINRPRRNAQRLKSKWKADDFRAYLYARGSRRGWA